MSSEISAKTRAYLRAAEVVRRARAERGLYDRKTAAAINKELQAIAENLVKSAQRNHNSEHVKSILAADPELAKRYQESKEATRFYRARATAERIAEKYREKKIAEAGK